VFKVALPYLEDQVSTQYWAHYGPLAQFDTPQRLMADLAQLNAGPVRGSRPPYQTPALHV